MTEWTVINETYTNDERGPWREYLVEGPMRPGGFAAPQLIVSVPERSSVPGFRLALHGQGMPGAPSDDELAAARSAVEAFRGAPLGSNK